MILYVRFVCDGKSKIVSGDNTEVADGKVEFFYDEVMMQESHMGVGGGGGTLDRERNKVFASRVYY